MSTPTATAFQNNNLYHRGHSAGYAEARDDFEAELLRMANRAERAEAKLHDLSLDLSTANHMIKLERDRADALQTRLKEIESALRKFNLI